jgi:hypothetical protein
VTPVVEGLADIVTVYPEKGFRDELTTLPVTEIAA